MKSINASGHPTKGITNRQLFFMLFMTLTTSTTIEIARGMAQTAGRTGWIPILVGALLFGVAAWIIAKLNTLHRGKVFFDYTRNIAGKFAPYLLGTYYLLYFLLIGIYLKMKYLGILSSNFLPKTPQFEMLFFSMVLFAYVAYKGLTNIARLLEIYGALFLGITTLICVNMMVQGMSQNILPLYNPNDVKQFAGAMVRVILPYGGIEVLFIVPFTQVNKKATKVAFLSLLAVGVFYVLIVESTIMILGINNTIAFNDPFIEAIKVADAPVIERLDVFYLTFGLTSLFSGMIIVFTAAVEFACKLFPKIKRALVVVTLALILYIVTLFALGIQDSTDILDGLLSYLIVISGFAIPFILIVLVKIKKRAGSGVSKENRYAS